MSDELVDGTVVTGALSRVGAGSQEGLGTYAITQGDLSFGPNYTIKFSETVVTFEITPRVITVTPKANQTKVYGQSDPVKFDYDYSPALVGGDVFGGALSRDTGEDVGEYEIRQNDLNLSSNYIINFVGGVMFSITPYTLTLTQQNTPTYDTTDQKINYIGDYQGADAGATWTVYTIMTNVGETGLTVTNDTIPATKLGNYILPTVNPTMTPADINGIVISVLSDTLEEDYTDNAVKSKDFTAIEGNLKLTFNNQNIPTTGFTFVHYNHNSTSVLANISLANGGTTHIIRSNIASYNNTNFTGTYTKTINQVSTNVIYKFKSVTIGNNTTYYTIEDALNKATSGLIIVKYNTSFSDADTAVTVYGTNNFTVKDGVTLLLPWSSAYDVNPGKGKINSTTINRDNRFVKLFIPSNNLTVDGNLIINAEISVSQPLLGFVKGSNYSELEMLEESIITVNGTMIVHGFVYGGTIISNSGSIVKEQMLISNFPGGSFSSSNYTYAMIFNEYGLNHIESDLTINLGASYFGINYTYLSTKVLFWDFTFDEFVDVKIIGNEKSFMFELSSGKVVKTFNVQTGKITLTLDNVNLQINDISVPIKYITDINMTSENKYLPIPGNFTINVINESLVQIKSLVQILPGAKVYVDESSTVKTLMNGGFIVMGANEYYYKTTNDRYGRGSSLAPNTYRVAPTFDYLKSDAGKLVVDGILHIYGSAGGIINTTSTSNVYWYEGAKHNFDINDFVNGAKGKHKYKLQKADGSEMIPEIGHYVVSDGGNTWTKQ